MKRLSLIAIALLSVLFFMGCATPPPAAPTNSVEEALHEVYQRFRGDIILIGASRHTVVAGETLAAISARHYPDGFYYPLIMLASSAVVLDPDRIEPGMVLTIPDLDRNMNSARARASMREFFFEIATIEENRGRAATANGIRAHARAM